MERAVMCTQGTLLMAMAHGLPIVSTPTHHALELLYDSRGLLVHYNDNGTALAEGLNALLKSSSLRSTMVRKSMPIESSSALGTIFSRVACKRPSRTVQQRSCWVRNPPLMLKSSSLCNMVVGRYLRIPAAMRWAHAPAASHQELSQDTAMTTRLC